MARVLVQNSNEVSVPLRNGEGQTLQLQPRSKTYVDDSFTQSLPAGVKLDNRKNKIPPQAVTADANEVE